MSAGFLSLHPANATSEENAAILKNPNVVYNVVYFEYSHVAAIARDTLSYANLPWKNTTVVREDDWKDKTPTPFKVLPYVEVQLASDPSKSVIVAESLNVDPFLAGRAGLLGANEWEELVIRAIYNNTLCMREAFYQDVAGSPSTAFDNKVAAGKKFAETSLAKWIEALEFHLKENARQNAGGYAVGSKISLADLAIDNAIDTLSQYPEELFKPALEAIRKSASICKVVQLVDSEPRLQAWRQSDEYSTHIYKTWAINHARHGNPAKRDVPIVRAATPADNRAILVRYGILQRA